MHDAWFFVGVFVFIFLIWIATGGPTNPLAFTGPVLPEPQELGGGTYLSFPRAPFSIGGGYVSLPGSTGNQSSSYEGVFPIPSLHGTVFGTPSPFRGRVSLSGYVTNASSTDSREEYLELVVAEGSAPVNITGWRVVSEVTGKSATIPQGTVTPVAGKVNATQDIVVSPGERVLIVSGVSPIGVSFRENKCSGYLSSHQQFTPPLPQSCPSPESELKSSYGQYYIRDTVCVDYVHTFASCQAVPFPRKTYQGEPVTEACRSFILEHLNYNGCVEAHRNNPDFHENVWRIYLKQNKYLWRDRYEVVKLLDGQYRTIDAFAY